MAWILCWLLVGVSFASPASRAQALADRAHEKLDVDPLKAYQLAGKALEADGQNLEAHYIRGSAGLTIASRLTDARYVEMARTLAKQDLEFVAEHSTDPFEIGLVRTLLGAGRPPVLADPLVACSPEATMAFDQAEAALGRKDYSTARSAYEQAVTACPANAVWWAYYGDAWFNDGEYGIAREKYNRALQIEPCYWSALRFRGDAYMHEGNVVAGMADTLTALACNPGYEIGWGYLSSTVGVAGATLTREPVYKPEPKDVARSDLPSVWTAYYAARTPNPEGDVLEQERRGIRAGVAAWRELPGPPTSALWSAMAAADTNGTLDPAIYIWFFDAELLPGFLEYRKDHLQDLVDYIRADVVVFPDRAK